MRLLKSIVVDDEKPAGDRFSRLLQGMGVEVIARAYDGLEALQKIAAHSADVVFLDIEMPRLNGLEVAASLPLNGPKIVFVTAYDEFALKAFETYAIDYLLKPVANDRIARAIQKIQTAIGSECLNPEVQKSLQERSQRVAIKVGSTYKIFPHNKISSVQAIDHYCEIVVDDKKVLVDESLEELTRKLSPYGFERVHRSYLINTLFVDEICCLGDRKYLIRLTDFFGTELPISRSRLPQIKALLRSF